MRKDICNLEDAKPYLKPCSIGIDSSIPGGDVSVITETVFDSIGGVYTLTRVEQSSITQSKAIYIDAMQSKRRDAILTDLYKTGRLNGLYFDRKSKSKNNPIKFYIKSCLYKQRINADAGLVDDCYNEMFKHLSAIPAYKICDMADNAPKKLIGTALKIISLKCFAVDPRYKNPKHSLVQSMLHTSTLNSDNMTVPSHECYMDNEELVAIRSSIGLEVQNETPRVIITSHYNDVSEFAQEFGFDVEDIESMLTPEELEVYEGMIGKQRRGKVPTDTTLQRVNLFIRLAKIVSDRYGLEQSGDVAPRYPRPRKFKGSKYEL